MNWGMRLLRSLPRMIPMKIRITVASQPTVMGRILRGIVRPVTAGSRVSLPEAENKQQDPET